MLELPNAILRNKWHKLEVVYPIICPAICGYGTYRWVKNNELELKEFLRTLSLRNNGVFET